MRHRYERPLLDCENESPRHLALFGFILLLFFTGCAATGAVIEDGGTALGILGTAEFFGPGIGFLSTWLWKFFFGWTASEVSGTHSARIDNDTGKVTSGIGDGIGEGLTDQLTKNIMDSPLFWFVFAAIFIAVGGPAWLKGVIKKADDEQTNHKRDLQAKLDTQALKLEQLQRDFDRLERSMERSGRPST